MSKILALDVPVKKSLNCKSVGPPRASSLPPGVNAIDHSIYTKNGSTSALEYAEHRLQAAKLKPTPDLVTRLEELTRELGYQRQEIHFYRQCFENLQRLRENSYDVFQQLFITTYIPPTQDHLKELMGQLHRGLEDSVQREAKAEKEWKAFWGIDYNTNETRGELI